MPTDVPGQLDGIARVLRELVAPVVTDPYVTDVLRGAIATLEVIAASSDHIVPFLRWDIEATCAVLESIGVEPPAAPPDPVDPAVLAQHHRHVRAALESAIPRIRLDAAASARTSALFRERAQRYPLVSQYRGGTVAQPSR